MKLTEWGLSCENWKIKLEGEKRYKTVTLFSTYLTETDKTTYNLKDLTNAHEKAEKISTCKTHGIADCWLSLDDSYNLILDYKKPNGDIYYTETILKYFITNIEDREYVASFTYK